jgi:hypothetical protein
VHGVLLAVVGRLVTGKRDQHIGDVCGVVAGPVWQPREVGEFAGEFARRALGWGGDIDDGDPVAECLVCLKKRLTAMELRDRP